jgi:cytidine deaminase
MRRLLVVSLCLAAACRSARERPWRLTDEGSSIVSDQKLERQIFQALDAARNAGTDPGISKYHVRCATVVEHGGREQVILGGNTEYAHAPLAIHGESSLLNHVTNLLGPDVARQSVRFIAFYSDSCGGGGSCGDCRDYLMAATRYQELIVACGQTSDHTVRAQKFSDSIVPESRFPETPAAELHLDAAELESLVGAAQEARRGGVFLLTDGASHLGAAALSFAGRTYRAAGADDAAFHYRFPIGGALQQAATERDYFIRAVLVAGEPGQWPRISYRDRQYGFEFSSFNRNRGRQPIELILTDGQGRFRRTTFEEALPFAFSTADFAPQALERFLPAVP